MESTDIGRNFEGHIWKSRHTFLNPQHKRLKAGLKWVYNVTILVLSFLLYKQDCVASCSKVCTALFAGIRENGFHYVSLDFGIFVSLWEVKQGVLVGLMTTLASKILLADEIVILNSYSKLLVYMTLGLKF